MQNRATRAELQSCTFAELHTCRTARIHAKLRELRMHAELRTHADPRTHACRTAHARTHARRAAQRMQHSAVHATQCKCMQHSAANATQCSACNTYNTAQRMQHSAANATQRSECNTAQRMHNGATLLYSRELWQFHAAQRNGTTIAPQRNFVRVDAAGCTSRCDSRRGIYVILCPATSCVCVCACVCVCSHELHERNCTPQCVCVCVGRIDNEITPH